MTAKYDDAFNLRRRHPLARWHLMCNAVQSHIARYQLPHHLNIAYGDTNGQTLDIFPAAAADAPVMVFIHGGYFRALDKKQYAYMARAFVKKGMTLVLLNYDLAPAVTVKTIIAQILRGFSWVNSNIQRYQGNPHNITLCGHSVGAFLVAKILQQSWPAEISQSITGAVMLSGLYDLGPMRASFLNQSLNLSEGDVESLSPVYTNTVTAVPGIIAVGEKETDEFIRQSRDFYHKMKGEGHSFDYLLLDNKNHYTVSRQLSHVGNPLMQRILSLMEGSDVG